MSTKTGAPDFTEAVWFASTKHRGQLRKDGATPYIQHPIRVAGILRDLANIEDPHVLCAAVLHDTLEDTDTSRVELEARFGRAVADMVAEVTDDKSLSKEERKAAQVLAARNYSLGAGQIKIADKIANLIDIVRAPPPWPADTKRKYYEHAREVVEAIGGPHPVLLGMFFTTYRDGLSSIA